MARNVNIETIQFKLQDFGKLKAVDQTFNKLNKSIGFSKKEINEAIKSITNFDQRNKGANNTATRSVNTFNKQIAALRELQNNVAIGGKAYKAFGAEADRLRAKLEALTGTQKKAGFFGKMSVGGQAAAGAMVGASASRFLPAGAATGASLGFVAGGAPGAAAGAAIGLGVDAVAGGARFASESASYAADIQKLQIALKGVTKNQKDFTKGLDVIAKTSRRLNVPIAASTRQFTTLSASVLGAGGTIEDAEEVFTGVSNAIKATGGNAEDVQSAIRAMSQIFGKGKVSAEELQGQLGERLAGAVVKFAEANGSSLQKLQKDLRDGTVGLGQIMNFAKKLNVDFAETAAKVADSSADAGQRLQTSMDRLKLAVGTILQPIGAAFQKVFGNIVNAITEAIEAFNKFMGIGLGNAIEKTEKALADIDKQLEAAEARNNKKLVSRLKSRQSQLKLDLTKLTKDLGEEAGRISNLPDATTPPSEDTINKYLLSLGEITQKEFESRELKSQSLKILKDLKAANIDLGLSQDEIIAKLKESKKETFNFKEALRKVVDTAMDLGTNMEKLAVDSIGKFGDAFAELVVTGKSSFAELTRSILADLQKMIVKALFFKTLFALVPGLESFLSFGKGGVVGGSSVDNTYGTGVPSNPSSVFGSVNAKGNVFAKNKVIPYASGGIVRKPTIFPMANGMGLMGEAGPEAIMPLKRGSNGKLGVQASGMTSNIVVNVDATGSNVEADEEQSRQLGRLIGMAVQSEIVQQQRPGGLLA